MLDLRTPVARHAKAAADIALGLLALGIIWAALWGWTVLFAALAE